MRDRWGRRLRRAMAGAMATGLLLAGLIAVPAFGAGQQEAAAETTVTVDGTSPGRTFDGVGAISAGGTSRLLFDYPEPARGQVLDYLFKPDYGAALQILKVEIGGDTDSTSGSEPSHQRTSTEVDCDRGYEWWLMEQAKARNPDIRLSALAWGSAGWTGTSDHTPWTPQYITYLTSWLDCAKQHGLTIDYIGGWNEHPGNVQWFKDFKKALATSAFPDIKLVAADQWENWDVVDDLTADAGFRAAVDVVGMHNPCDARTEQITCPYLPPQAAKDLNKPLWASEMSSQAHDVGGRPLARALNRQYIDGRITGHITWSLSASWLGNVNLADTGLALADRPWSGYYDIDTSIWAMAHTAQFTAPGWRYLDTASGRLPGDGGGTYVSLRSPTTGDWSTVAETIDASAPVTVHLKPQGGLSSGRVQVWDTDMSSHDHARHFVHTGDLEATDGVFTATLQPGHLYTFSTTSGGKGTAVPTGTVSDTLALPFAEDFEGYDADRLARYFSDLNGGFATEPCRGGRSGMCYGQQVTTLPVGWTAGGGRALGPDTMVGDPRWWGDYTVSADVLPDQAETVHLTGRLTTQAGFKGEISDDRLEISKDGSWRLYGEEVKDFAGSGTGADKLLASGTVPFASDTWHHVDLSFQAQLITVVIDGKTVGTAHEYYRRTGQVAFGVRDRSDADKWERAQFDNIRVTPTLPAPSFVPAESMSAVATSEHAANYHGYSFPAGRAVDGRPETYWHSAFDAALPQSLTVDLGQTRTVHGITYQPRLDGGSNGMITKYTVLTSTDGTNFTEADSGSLPLGTGTKALPFTPRAARYVRLRADAGDNGNASVGELGVATSPIPTSSSIVPVDRTTMTATASSAQSGYPAGRAVDGSTGTFWHSQYDPKLPLPQDLTLDLGSSQPVLELTQTPRQDGNEGGYVSGYEIWTSVDGTGYRKVAAGTWAATSTAKTVTWPVVDARYVRLRVTAGVRDVASVAEITVHRLA